MTVPPADSSVTREVDRVTSTDGWSIGVDVTADSSLTMVAGALTVPATKHERDGWGPAMIDQLVARGFVVMRSDIRGRGNSRVPDALPSLPPGHLRRVVDDVGAAVDRLAEQRSVASGSIVLFGEQDTADAVTTVAFADRRVGVLVLVSPRLSAATLTSVNRRLPVCILASKDDRSALVESAKLFRCADHPASRFRLVGDVGSGTTMFAAWQYLRPDEPPLEKWLAAWAASVV